MKKGGLIVLSIVLLLLSNCNYIRHEAESKREPLKIYISGSEYGFGAIVYVEDGFQSGTTLVLDSNNIGLTSFPKSHIIQEAGKEPKYQFFRIVGNDTIPQEIGGHNNDSTNISSFINSSLKSGTWKNEYHYLQFYAGKYPERPIGVYIDSTEIGKWENLLFKKLEELDEKGIKPQKR